MLPDTYVRMSIENLGTAKVTLLFDENASVPNWKMPI